MKSFFAILLLMFIAVSTMPSAAYCCFDQPSNMMDCHEEMGDETQNSEECCHDCGCASTLTGALSGVVPHEFIQGSVDAAAVNILFTSNIPTIPTSPPNA